MKYQRHLKNYDSKIMKALQNLHDNSGGEVSFTDEARVIAEVPLTHEEVDAILHEAGYTPEELEEFITRIQKLVDAELAKKKMEEENKWVLKGLNSLY